jgi:hypothetical protein
VNLSPALLLHVESGLIYRFALACAVGVSVREPMRQRSD